jgi:aspartyl aminopeptidase
MKKWRRTMKKNKDAVGDAARDLLGFIDRSPTPFHAVAELTAMLAGNGFKPLDESEAWELEARKGYFVVRNGSALVAFRVGEEPAERAGFKIIGAHTDSPNLRLKPNPVTGKNGYVQLGVEVYGGALLTTWTDRDLSLAGRVVLRAKKSLPVCRLLKIDRPLLRIPQLAIHLNRNVNDKGLILNPQTHLAPIFTLQQKRSGDVLKEFVSAELGCKSGDIVSLELSLFDVQKSAFGGLEGEFIFAPRLDNLASCHASATALAQVATKDAATRVLAFYDDEEVGSQTAQGGHSPFLRDVLERIVARSAKPREAFMRAVARSFFISADMAHAVHPNYSEMHEANHMPILNGGPVIKTNAGRRYATEGVSSAVFESLCERAGVAVQKFVVRSDLACGSTIGPVTAANLGVRTVDVGNPMLAMHSAREMAGAKDHASMIRVFKEFFNSATALSEIRPAKKI